MGQFIKIPGVTPGNDRPKVDLVDSIAPDSGGLLLIDAKHPVKPAFSTGVPSNGSTVANVLSAQAASLLGVTEDAVTTSLTVSLMTATSSSSTGRLERTAKGGLHVIMPTGTVDAALGVAIPMPAAIVNYLAANPGHAIFASLWGYLTRPTDGTQGWAAADSGDPSGAGSGSSLLFSFGNDGTNYPAGSTRVGFRRAPAGAWRPSGNANIAPSPFILNNGLTGYTGTVGAARRGKAFAVGASGTQFRPFPGAATGGNPSGVFYRFYMEDLTVSGRTYAQLDTLDFAAYTAQVLTAGGRYYGDTYTSPSAVAA